MTSRDRVRAALRHQAPDRVPVDLGSTAVTGIHVAALNRLRAAVLGPSSRLPRVHEPYQMLGEVDRELRDALGLDAVGVFPRQTMFGFERRDWKRIRLFDGTECEVPGGFVITETPEGDWLIHPQGDPDAPPSARMPAGGYFFDSIIRQPPIDEARLDPADNAEEFTDLTDEDLNWYRAEAERAAAEGRAVVLSMPGTAFGDIALVPAPWMKQPRGIRDVEEWYVSLAARPAYVRAVFDRQLEIALRNLERMIARLGELVDVVLLTGTDFGEQRGLFVSPEMYRELFKPYHIAVNRLVHARSQWATMIHSCGSVFDLIPDFIEAGFDVLTPVQCSAAKMDPRTLKRDFGRDLVFWGGGVNTQQTLPFGTPEQVYREVRERIEIFGEGGGFVFNTIHNIQANTPTENMLAMFRAIRDSAAS
ncbi:MAG: methyltransferase [Kiritimatiellae bacterium]|nr:methyltransferase [Kiritimatiellia bacterium]